MLFLIRHLLTCKLSSYADCGIRSERAIEQSNTSVGRNPFVQSPRTYFSLLICNEGKAQVEKDFFPHIGSTPSNNGIYL